MARLVLLLALAGAPTAHGQETEPTIPTPETIQQKINELEQASNLAEDVRKSLLSQYRQALAETASAKEARLQAAEFQRAIDEAPQLLPRLQEQLDAQLETPRVSAPADASLTMLEQGLAETKARFQVARQELVELESEPARREQRRRDIPESLAGLRTKLNGLKELQARPASPEETSAAVSAKKVLLASQRAATEAQIELLEKETARYEARRELLLRRRELKKRETTQLETLQQAWQERVNQERERQAKEAARAARAADLRADPRLHGITAENLRLAQERTGGEKVDSLARKLSQVSAALVDSQSELAKVETQHRTAKDRDLTGPYAQLLLKERVHLPNPRLLRKEIAVLDSETVRAQSRLLEIDDRIGSFKDVDAEVADLLAESEETRDSAVHEDLDRQARQLFGDQKLLLEQLHHDYSQYINDLVELRTNRQRLEQEVEHYLDFIEGKLVWTRTHSPLNAADVRRAGNFLREFFAPSVWWELGSSMIQDSVSQPVRSSLLVLVLLGIALGRPPLGKRLRRLHQLASSWQTDSFRSTVEACLILGFQSLGLPAIFWCLALSLHFLPDPPRFAADVSVALVAVGAVLFTLDLFRRFVRPGGVCNVHFRWPTTALRHLHRATTVLLALTVPLLVLFLVMERQVTEAGATIAARLALTLTTTLVAIFLAVTLRPSGPTLTSLAASNPNAWLNRLRFLWYPVVILTPLLLGSLAAMGFTFTAIELLESLWASFQFVLGLLLFQGLVLRWLFIARRRLAIEQARQRREQAGSESESGEPEGLEQLQFNLSAIDQKTRKLVKSAVTLGFLIGFWWIWQERLPALRALNEIPLWTDTSAVAAGGAAQEITLANLLLALILGTMTILAARNLPGLIEILILNRLPLDSGSRFALVTVITYMIVGIGLFVAFSTVGIGWSKVQWLVAAMSVGLGFGLQEIFANFVSGLIILFERPIRIGDIVSVGTITGRVTRIRIRATTITDWDRRELVVPNKEFITGQLINWTLTDPITRVVIPIGVAYGSDTDRARELLLRAAKECPHVMTEPKPSATFESFGESSLDFKLRVYVATRDVWLELMHDLHSRINKLFEAAGIVIAFPQRDIHIRSGNVSVAQPYPLATERGSPGS